MAVAPAMFAALFDRDPGGDGTARRVSAPRQDPAFGCGAPGDSFQDLLSITVYLEVVVAGLG